MSNRLMALIIVLVIVSLCSALFYVLFIRNVATGTIHVNATGATISFGSDFTSDNFPLAGKILRSTTRHTLTCDETCSYRDIPAIHYIIKAEKEGYETAYIARSLVTGNNPDITIDMKPAKKLSEYKREPKDILQERILANNLRNSYPNFADKILGYAQDVMYLYDKNNGNLYRFSDKTLTLYASIPSASGSLYFDPQSSFVAYGSDGMSSMLDLKKGKHTTISLSWTIAGIKQLDTDEYILMTTDGRSWIWRPGSPRVVMLTLYDDILRLTDGSTLGLIRSDDTAKKILLEIPNKMDESVIVREDSDHRRHVIFSTPERIVRLEKTETLILVVLADGTIKTLGGIGEL